MKSKSFLKYSSLLMLLLIAVAIFSAPASASVLDDLIQKDTESLQTLIGVEGSTADTTNLQDELHKYGKNVDVWFMTVIIAFLMIFIKKFEWSVCLATMLVTAGSFLAYTAIQQFVFGNTWSQDFLIMAIFCSITVVIAMGVFLGTIKPWQYLLAGVLFAPSWMAVDWFMNYYLEGVVDPGGSMLVHMVAAYWGWGVILALREKRAFNEPMKTTTHSVSLVWLAAMLLFVFWPSFVTALAPADMVTWGMATTYMAGLGSVISAYVTCIALEKKVNPLVYTYAMLAGMVAIGSPLLSVGPWGALIIGILAGIISVISFVKIHPVLCEKLGVLDVMGVHNLHGIVGVFGAIVGAIVAAGFVNIISLVGVIVISLITGFISGIVLKLTRGKMSDDELFSDEKVFIGWSPE